MVTFAETMPVSELVELTGATVEDIEEGVCVDYYPGMLFDMYDEDQDVQERLFMLQFFGVGEGIEVPGSS
ncbi:MAG: hypothetical protein LDL33_07635 [Desulfomonile sp.]|nr:hypothetical protein [Desulfomonile sp.]